MSVILHFDTNRRKGCELCISVCPKDMLKFATESSNVKGYHAATVVDIAECIACASCAKICPDSVITIDKT